MAFLSLLRRTALPILLSTALTTCSISDGLVPPENVDSSTRVSSISPVRGGAMRMAPVQSQQPYPVASAP
ncbi:MAG: extensin, partial [Rhizobium sp.]